MFRCSMQDLTLHKMFSADPICMQKWTAELQGVARYQQLQQHCRHHTAGCRAASRLKFLHADKFCSVTLGPSAACLGNGKTFPNYVCILVISSASKSSIRRFVITEKAPTRAFSWLKAATTAFTFKTLLRHYAKQALS